MSSDKTTNRHSPTGGGKSLFFMLPSVVDPLTRLTVLILPLRALLVDVSQRLDSAGIAFQRWDSSTHSDFYSNLVVVSADVAIYSRLRFRLRAAHSEGGLGRVIIDEAPLL